MDVLLVLYLHSQEIEGFIPLLQMTTLSAGHESSGLALEHILAQVFFALRLLEHVLESVEGDVEEL